MQWGLGMMNYLCGWLADFMSAFQSQEKSASARQQPFWGIRVLRRTTTVSTPDRQRLYAACLSHVWQLSHLNWRFCVCLMGLMAAMNQFSSGLHTPCVPLPEDDYCASHIYGPKLPRCQSEAAHAPSTSRAYTMAEASIYNLMWGLPAEEGCPEHFPVFCSFSWRDINQPFFGKEW